MIDVDEFLAEGFVKLEAAAPRAVADAARALLWEQMGLRADEPAGWLKPVVWASDVTGVGPFGELARSPRLAEALDRICGRGGWKPRFALGTIPVRFPVAPPDDDRGWHIDYNTMLPDGSWVVSGRPQTMLVLTLLSDVGTDDAPTRIRRGSHRDVAKVLDAHQLSAEAAGVLVDAATDHRPVAHATGVAGDMYLLHPFTVHAADEQRGQAPRFMAQTPVMLTEPLTPSAISPLCAVFGPRLTDDRH